MIEGHVDEHLTRCSLGSSTMFEKLLADKIKLELCLHLQRSVAIYTLSF